MLVGRAQSSHSPHPGVQTASRSRWVWSTVRKGNPVEMLADTPNVDGSTSANRSQPEDLLVRRIGLEQEFFLVDRGGMLSDLADPFLSQCQEAAQTEGLDPHCF